MYDEEMATTIFDISAAAEKEAMILITKMYNENFDELKALLEGEARDLYIDLAPATVWLGETYASLWPLRKDRFDIISEECFQLMTILIRVAIWRGFLLGKELAK